MKQNSQIHSLQEVLINKPGPSCSKDSGSVTSWLHSIPELIWSCLSVQRSKASEPEPREPKGPITLTWVLREGALCWAEREQTVPVLQDQETLPDDQEGRELHGRRVWADRAGPAAGGSDWT